MSSKALEKVKQLRKKHSREILSEFIRIQTSDLYDYNPGVRATLSTIAFLQVNDENAPVPEESPYKGDYVGWCYASQGYLAYRVGKSESQIQRDIQTFVNDDVILIREWHDTKGYHHLEYHVREEVVTAHQREIGDPRPKRNKRVYTTNKGSFSSTNQPKSHLASQPLPPSISAVSHLASHPSAIQHVSREATAEMPLEGVDLGGFVSGGKRGRLSASPSLRSEREPVASSEEQNQNQNRSGVLPNQDQNQEQPQRPAGVITKGQKQLLNKHCYPDLFKNWQPGRLLPKCNRCKEPLQPNEPAHECPGYLEGGQSRLGEAVYHPIAPKGTEVLKKRIVNFGDYDLETGILLEDKVAADEDDLSGYTDFDDDHLPARGAAAASSGNGFEVEDAE